MEGKVCKHCGEYKSIEEFPKSKNNKDGYSNVCRECKKKQKHNWDIKNKEHRSKYREEWHVKNRDINLLKLKEYREANKDYFKQKNKEYYAENKEKELERCTKYNKANRAKIHETEKKWIKANIERHRESRNKRSRYRYTNDPLFKMTISIRNMINKALKKNGMSKSGHTTDILGCSFEEFKIYLESKFEPWMNWDNYGNGNGIPTGINQCWDCDHIIPISSAQTEEDIIKLSHYTNIQPLCSYTNRYIKKDNMLDGV